MRRAQRSRQQAGVTLLELLIAGTIGLVILLGLAQTDVTRLLVGSRVRETAFRHDDARNAIGHLVKRLEAADQVVLLDASNAPCQLNCVSVQLRVPLGTNLDVAGNYQWMQYKLVSGQFRHYEPAASCTVATRFNDVSGFTLSYEDRSPAPPGGEPLGGSDSNLVQISLTSTWTDPQTGGVTTTTFPATVALRSAGYTNVSTGLSQVNSTPPPACS